MPTSAVKLLTAEPRPTAVIAQTTSWEEFPNLWSRLLDEVYAFVRTSEDLATERLGSPRWQNVMLYKDHKPTVEVGVLVAGPFSPEGRVIASQLPGGKAAMAVHYGDYAQLGRTHAAVRQFVTAERLALAGPRWEIYGHWRDDPTELETEIYYLCASG